MLRGLVCGVVVLSSSVVWPCSGQTCSAHVAPVPRTGTVIPWNTPAIGVQRAFFGSITADAGTAVWPLTPLVAELRTDGGTVSASFIASNVGTFIQPPTWAVGSSWSLDFSDDAGFREGVCVSPSTQFTVGPPAPIPTVAATITELDSQWSAGEPRHPCTEYPTVQLVRFRIEPTAEMQPWVALARWELEVDGRNANASPFGLVPAAGYDPEISRSWTYRQFNLLQVECEPGPSAIGPGLHSVRFLARIEGLSEPVPSNTLVVNVVCTPPDGGPAALDGGMTEPGGMSPRGGCSAVPGGLSLMALVALRRLRRRARQV